MDGVVDVHFVGKCPHCGEESEPPIPADLVSSLLKLVNSSVDNRLKSTEIAAKHGLASKELVVTDKQAATFFDCVYAAIVEVCDEKTAETVKTRAVAMLDEVKG